MSTTLRREKFEKLAQKAEKEYQKNSKKYKNTIKLLMILGYGYLFLILAVLLSVVALSIFLAIKTSWFWLFLIKKKLIIVLIFLIYVLFKALFIKIPAPQGHRLKTKHSPELFKQVEILRKNLKAPKIHEIIITSEFNAAICQTPRLGLIGWQKNSLILGLPLLMALNEKQTLAVIGHEMGHLAGDHSKFNGWIYRSRTSWMHIAMSLQNITGIVGWLFGRFMNWYAPYFSAYTFALARANEYEADDIAGQLTNAEDLASALTKTYVLPSLVIDSYWKSMERQAYSNDAIEQKPFTKLLDFIQEKKLDSTQVTLAINDCMREKTNYANTHPSLAERLKNLKMSPQFDFDIKHSTLNLWFQNSSKDIIELFDNQWQSNNQKAWRELNNQGKEALERLESLKAQTENNDRAMVLQNLTEQAHITHVLYGKSQSEALYKKIFEMDNQHPEACFYYGSQLVAQNDSKGVELLKPLMEQESYIIPAGEILYDYFTKSEQKQQAEEVLINMEKKSDLDDQYLYEINTLSENDVISKDDLNDKEYSDLQKLMVNQDIAAHVWIAKKPLLSYPQERMHIIIYQLKYHEQEQEWSEWLDNNWSISGIYVGINNKKHRKLALKIIKSARKIK